MAHNCLSMSENGEFCVICHDTDGNVIAHTCPAGRTCRWNAHAACMRSWAAHSRSKCVFNCTPSSNGRIFIFVLYFLCFLCFLLLLCTVRNHIALLVHPDNCPTECTVPDKHNQLSLKKEMQDMHEALCHIARTCRVLRDIIERISSRREHVPSNCEFADGIGKCKFILYYGYVYSSARTKNPDQYAPGVTST